MSVFAYLEASPIIEIQKTAAALNMAFNTVASAITRLTQAGILQQSNSASRNRIFAYADYLDILRGVTQ